MRSRALGDRKGGLEAEKIEIMVEKVRGLFILFLPVLLLGIVAPVVKAQKCTYDTKGMQGVPFVFETVTFRVGNVRVLKGIVSDPIGAPMANVAIALFKAKSGKEAGRDFVGSTQTDEKGTYCFGPLPRGHYIMEVGTHGFKRTVIEFKVASGGSTTGKSKVDVRLEHGI